MKRPLEKKHRLPAGQYVGPKTVSFTACIRYRRQAFRCPEIVEVFRGMLERWTVESRCVVPVYCFMPDHLHVMISGCQDDSRPKEAMDEFKESSGTWFAQNRPEFHWQKDYHDHIVRKSDDWRRHVRYILRNPVRAGLVEYPLEYPFTGSIGIPIEAVLWEL